MHLCVTDTYLTSINTTASFFPPTCKRLMVTVLPRQRGPEKDAVRVIPFLYLAVHVPGLISMPAYHEMWSCQKVGWDKLTIDHNKGTNFMTDLRALNMFTISVSFRKLKSFPRRPPPHTHQTSGHHIRMECNTSISSLTHCALYA